MKKVFFYLILTSVLTLFASTSVLAEPVNKVPWMIFTYGIPGLALLVVIIPFFLHLIGGGED